MRIPEEITILLMKLITGVAALSLLLTSLVEVREETENETRKTLFLWIV
jgi:hypothetical protein